MIWGGLTKWPGPLHEGNGEIQPFVNDSANDDQRNAVFEILSGKHGDSLMEVMAYVAPTVHEPIVAPIDFEFDLRESKWACQGRRRCRGRGRDAARDRSSRSLPVLVKIPDGMEYTNDDESAETAQAKRITANGAIKLDITDGHASMCSRGTGMRSARAGTSRLSSRRRSADKALLAVPTSGRAGCARASV